MGRLKTKIKSSTPNIQNRYFYFYLTDKKTVHPKKNQAPKSSGAAVAASGLRAKVCTE